ncbi:MAG TPA: DUF3810 domain-containing protein [Clostridiales bacterium]|nr:DUF3810 domain-containing protein [Clostridiales bacterium]
MKLLRFFKHPSWYLWLLPALFAFGAQRLLARFPEVAEEIHARRLFRWLSLPIAALTSLVPFSLTELLLVVGCPLLLIGLIIWLVRLIRRPSLRSRRRARAGRLARRLAWCASLAYLFFMLLHGFNYARLPVSDSFNLPVRERDADDLMEAAVWLTGQASLLRQECLEDENGVFELRSGITGTLKTAHEGYDAAAPAWPLLDGPAIRPKSVLLSPYWSYTGITGMYFPFFVESNINTDAPEYSIPETILHEIAHTRGFAREDEAGFLAFLAGVAHPDPDFAYSVLLDAAVRCLNSLYAADPEAWKQAAANLSEAAWRDLSAGGAYWKQFEGPVRETSNKINDTYLQANLQEDGVRSYGRMIDLVLAWYEIRTAEGTLDRAVAALHGQAASGG